MLGRIGRLWSVPVWMAAAVALTGCEKENTFVEPPPPEVTVASPVERSIADSIEFTGTTRARMRVELRPRVSGHLMEIKFEDGQTVEEGQDLFLIDPAPFEAELLAANAQKQKANAALDLAQANFERTEELVRRKVTTQQERDVAEAEVETARAEVAVAEAAIVQANLQLSYTRVTAPISGRIGRHLADVGNLIQTEQTLAVIESIGPIHAYFNVSERDLLRFMEMLRHNALPDPDEQQPVLYLGLGNEEGFPHVGRLDFRELGVDPGTGTVVRRGLFPNETNELIPGLFVRIRADLGEPIPRVMVEERAIGSDQRGDFVLVVDAENKVEYRPVKLGISAEGMRVVEQGLKLNERIVVNGLQRARPGAVVAPREAQAEVADDGTEEAGRQSKESARRTAANTGAAS